MGIWDNVDIDDSLLLDEHDMNIFHNAEHNHEKNYITSTTNITDQPNMEDDDSTNNPHTP